MQRPQQRRATDGAHREPFPTRAWIVPWPDIKLDQRGHDPRSTYAEAFWLGVIGPSASWLVRRVAARLDDDPGGFEVDCREFAAELGLSVAKGHISTFGKAVKRCVMFGVAYPLEAGVPGWAFRRRLPTVPARHLNRMPERIRALHADWYRNELAAGAAS